MYSLYTSFSLEHKEYMCMSGHNVFTAWKKLTCKQKQKKKYFKKFGQTLGFRMS